MPGISIDRVTKRFSGGTVAVNELSMEIADGEFVVFVGPSGCGKTTLLRMIAGLEEVTEGRIVIGDKDVTRLPARDRDIAMVFQDYALYPFLNVEQNLAFGLRLRKLPKSEIAERVRDVARMLGLETMLGRRPGELSGGQRQRVAMGRAMTRKPQAFLMDEPLSNLDAKLRVQMRAELARLREELRTTTIYVTHDQIEAMTLGDRVAVLHNGIVQQFDSPAHLFKYPANLFVASFIGSPAMNLVEAELGRSHVSFGSFQIPLADTPAELQAHVGETVTLGIRPSAFADASCRGPSSLPTIEVTPDVVELLGEDVLIFFPLDATAVVTEEVRSAITEQREEADLGPFTLGPGQEAVITARTEATTNARPGHPLQLAVDPSRLYFFDRESGHLLGPRPRDTALPADLDSARAGGVH